MANPEHLTLLRKSIPAWNEWRIAHREFVSNHPRQEEQDRTSKKEKNLQRSVSDGDIKAT